MGPFLKLKKKCIKISLIAGIYIYIYIFLTLNDFSEQEM